MLDEDDGVCSGQRQPQASYVGGEEQEVDGGVRVERLLDLEAARDGGGPVHPEVGGTGELLPEQVSLDDVEHRAHLREDEDATAARLLLHSDAALDEELV
eukprot:754578-Hanusia_phi.AAC.7